MRIQATIELPCIESNRFRRPLQVQVSEDLCPPIFEGVVVKLPEMTLRGSAFRSFRRLRSIRQDWELMEAELNVTRLNEFLDKLSPWPEGEILAVSSGEIGKLGNDHWCRLVPKHKASTLRRFRLPCDREDSCRKDDDSERRQEDLPLVPVC